MDSSSNGRRPTSASRVEEQSPLGNPLEADLFGSLSVESPENDAILSPVEDHAAPRIEITPHLTRGPTSPSGSASSNQLSLSSSPLGPTHRDRVASPTRSSSVRSVASNESVSSIFQRLDMELMLPAPFDAYDDLQLHLANRSSNNNKLLVEELPAVLPRMLTILYGISISQELHHDTALSAFAALGVEILSEVAALKLGHARANSDIAEQWGDFRQSWADFRKTPSNTEQFRDAFYDAASLFGMIADFSPQELAIPLEESTGSLPFSSLSFNARSGRRVSITPPITKTAPSSTTQSNHTPTTSTVDWAVALISLIVTFGWILGEIISGRYLALIPLGMGGLFFVVSLSVRNAIAKVALSLTGLVTLLWAFVTVAVLCSKNAEWLSSAGPAGGCEGSSDVVGYNYPFYYVFFPFIALMASRYAILCEFGRRTKRRKMKALKLGVIVFWLVAVLLAIIVRQLFVFGIENVGHEPVRSALVWQLFVECVVFAQLVIIFPLGIIFGPLGGENTATCTKHLGALENIPQLKMLLRESSPALQCVVSLELLQQLMVSFEVGDLLSPTKQQLRQEALVGSPLQRGRPREELVNENSSPLSQSSTRRASHIQAQLGKLRSPIPFGKIILAGNSLCPGGEMLIETDDNTTWRAPLAVSDTTVVVGVNKEEKIVSWPKTAGTMTGITVLDALNRSMASLFTTPVAQRKMSDMIQAVLNSKPIEISTDMPLVGELGVPVDVVVAPAKSTAGQMAGVVVVLGITKRSMGSLLPVWEKLLELQHDLGKEHCCAQRLFVLSTELRAAILPPDEPTCLFHVFDYISKMELRSANIKTMLDEDVKTVLLMINGSAIMSLFIQLCKSVLELSQTNAISVSAQKRTVGGKMSVVEVRIKPSSRRQGTTLSHSYTEIEAARVTFDEEQFVIVELPFVLANKKNNANVQEEALQTDSTRCTVVLLDENFVTQNMIRTTLFKRGHFVTSVATVQELIASLENVDVLITRLPPEHYLYNQSKTAAQEKQRHLEQFLETRPGLVSVAIPSRGYLPESSSFLHTLESDFLLEDLHRLIDQLVEQVQKQKQQEKEYQAVKALLTQQKACPWERGRLLGKGSFATVYEATNTVTGGKMAVRVIPISQADPERAVAMMKNIVEEVRVMTSLEHPNIIQYLYCESDGGNVNIFTELAPKGSLRSYLDDHRVQTETQIAEWMEQVIRGLQYLHNEGIVHHDLKCDNILLTRSGCKIADFGTAKLEREVGSSRDGETEGTMLFMAPELFASSRDRTVPPWTVDIWALGCCLMEMATGRTPWAHVAGSPLAAVNYVSELASVSLNRPPVPLFPPNISENVKHMITACLRLNPRDRPSCHELLDYPLLTGRKIQHLTSLARQRSFLPNRSSSVSSSPTDEDDRRESCFSTWSIPTSRTGY